MRWKGRNISVAKSSRISLFCVIFTQKYSSMHKKLLSCLSYILLLTISFLLPGFMEAAQLPQKSFSAVSDASIRFSFPEIASSVFTATAHVEEMAEKSAVIPLQQTEIFAVTPEASVNRGQSEQIRRFPVAVFFLYCRQSAFRQLAADYAYSFTTNLSAVPGLPVLFRTLRL